MRRAALAFALVATAFASCSDTFPPAWRVANFRVLGVKAEPPDALPGETVTLTLVTAAPQPAREVNVAWTGCARMVIDGATGMRACAPGAELAPFTGNPARFVASQRADDGSPYTLFGLACAGGTPTLDPMTLRPRCTAGESAAFLRTVRVRQDEANHNPRIARILFDRTELNESFARPVAPCSATDEDERLNCPAHRVAIEFARDARDMTRVVQPDGRVDMVPEVLISEFLVDRGDLYGAFRSDADEAPDVPTGTHGNLFTPPPSGDVRLWFIVRDGRGGFDFATRTLRVAP